MLALDYSPLDTGLGLSILVRICYSLLESSLSLILVPGGDLLLLLLRRIGVGVGSSHLDVRIAVLQGRHCKVIAVCSS